MSFGLSGFVFWGIWWDENEIITDYAIVHVGFGVLRLFCFCSQLFSRGFQIHTVVNKIKPKKKSINPKSKITIFFFKSNPTVNVYNETEKKKEKKEESFQLNLSFSRAWRERKCRWRKKKSVSIASLTSIFLEVLCLVSACASTSFEKLQMLIIAYACEQFWV